VTAAKRLDAELVDGESLALVIPRLRTARKAEHGEGG
jgi:hypothetical protein